MDVVLLMFKMLDVKYLSEAALVFGATMYPHPINFTTKTQGLHNNPNTSSLKDNFVVYNEHKAL